MSPLAGVLVVGTGLGGLSLVVASHPRLRRPRLAARLHPWVVPQRGRSAAPAPGLAGLREVLRSALDDAGRRLQRALGDDGRDLEERLAAAGSDLTPSGFRSEQAAWAIGGFTSGVALAALAVASGRAFSPPALLGAAVLFGAAGAIARDRLLTRAVEARRARMVAEFPTFADLVCLAVTAGESLRGALDLVVSRSDGPLAAEVRGALRQVRTGLPLAEALPVAQRRIGIPAFDRFVGAALAAHERGVPLADALRAMAFDVRQDQKNDVIEAAGRKQVSMLVPVVALVLPVSILFAFYPGVLAIRQMAG